MPGAAISRTWVEVSNPWRATSNGTLAALATRRMRSEEIRSLNGCARQARSGLSGILRNGIALTICPSSE
ncbi:Uncharacterised protein [Bordetella pertussis]|nr:Uncharacterised protein [Bordetella pertussis]CFN60994.1 Uncharacterised protein [Bordetella pertussis]CFN66804.1 Uncharacterised protein [Bordetella pertussis]CFN82097.1 Uncharacterised protein [Bordetella pertussis]CFO07349.1 Uncharacterised protein [Bordetella pertussis]